MKKKKVKAVWGPDFKTDPMNPFYNPPTFSDSAAVDTTVTPTRAKVKRSTFGAIKNRYRYGDEGE